MLFAGLMLLAVPLNADDDDPPRPPVDPGTGFEGILPDPRLPPSLILEQTTGPYGVRQVFNTPELIMGQAFRPTGDRLDWVAFVFQNSTQPGQTPGPGYLRARLYENLQRSSGTLTGLLAESAVARIPSNHTAWLVFLFPETVRVTAGQTYYCRLESVAGLPSWAGGRLQDFYPRGEAFGFLPNPFGGPVQDLRWERYDLAFAHGHGRSPLGDAVSDYVQWARHRGLNRVAEDADPDGDQWPNWYEFLRDTDPLSAGGGRVWDVRYGGDDGDSALEWTLTMPISGGWVAGENGSWTSRYGQVWDRISARSELDRPGVASGEATVVELPTPSEDGLATLSPFHQRRTVRLQDPRPNRSRGFLILQTGSDPASPTSEWPDSVLPSQGR